MGKTLYLMRHGETMFNEQQRIQGWCDSPLTERGCEQARAAGRALAERGVVFDHAVCSTAERAADTLELVLEAMGQPLPYERLKALKERFHGRLEGESERLNHGISLDEMDALLALCGGEARADVSRRTVPALLEVMARPECQCVLAVSHAGASLATVSEFVDAAVLRASGFGNCTIWVLDYVEPAEGAPATFELREIIHPV